MRVTATAPELVAPASPASDSAAPSASRVAVPMRVWPSGLPGHFSGEFVATEPGPHVIVAEAGAVRGRAVVMVQPDARRAAR